MKGHASPAPVVFWMIWFAILVGLFVLLFLAAGGIPEGGNAVGAPMGLVVAAGVAAAVSMVIRFLLIPGIRDPAKLLPVMILGLALAEAIGILGMFAVGREFSHTRMSLFFASVSAVVMYAPFYVHRLQERRKMH